MVGFCQHLAGSPKPPFRALSPVAPAASQFSHCGRLLFNSLDSQVNIGQLFSAGNLHLRKEIIHVDRASQFPFSVVLLEDSSPLNVSTVQSIINRIQKKICEPGRGVRYIDKPYRLSIYRHVLKISISIRSLLKISISISISIKTFIEISISISISIRTFLKISISISISIRSF